MYSGLNVGGGVDLKTSPLQRSMELNHILIYTFGFKKVMSFNSDMMISFPSTKQIQMIFRTGCI